ncbi:hypothetical protein [Novosphingobium beihaiensis]|uniref:Uncharacterized protein n=1 Tax=Novosphingobium beihaiensis TaxID=2930389 RepID=A0ABT0BRN4_9SPHN|nr:hypothetical protein [Novosphingobium beihaiensis]MCJ2187717.1 hypothetical protein [Novosphingobium beihaiensis]
MSMAESGQAKRCWIDPDALPDLDVLTGAFGSRADAPRLDAEDDNYAVLMPCLYPFALFD